MKLYKFITVQVSIKRKQMVKNWTNKTVKRSHPFYKTCLERFGKQYKNVKTVERVFVDEDGKVFAGEWIDGNGVLNIIGGVYPDIKKTINFIN